MSSSTRCGFVASVLSIASLPVSASSISQVGIGFNQEPLDEAPHDIAIISEHYPLLRGRGDFQLFSVERGAAKITCDKDRCQSASLRLCWRGS